MPDESFPLTRSDLKPKLDPQTLLAKGAATLFPGATHPEAALAGLLLKEGCWEESHEIAQDIPTPEGSYWHAIVHRIEPDAANSAYWFRQVGVHPVFPGLLKRANGILAESGPSQWRTEEKWDPFRFGEWYEEARREGGPGAVAVRAIQEIEIELLFAFCCSTSTPKVI